MNEKDVTNQMLQLGASGAKRDHAICMYRTANTLPPFCRILVIGSDAGYMDIALALTVKGPSAS